MMLELLTEYSILVTRYGSLIIYVSALTVGFTQIILWITGIAIRNIIGLKDFYKAFEYYLKSKNKD